MRYLLFVVVLTSTVVLAAAQTKVLTNADFEKYRLEREKAEMEYRENYARHGFPSPEELEKRRRQEVTDNQQFVLLLTQQLAEEERIESQRRSMVYYRYTPPQVVEPTVEYPFWGTYNRAYRNPFVTPKGQSGYFAGGQFWPTPVRTPIRLTTHSPVWTPHRTTRIHPK